MSELRRDPLLHALRRLFRRQAGAGVADSELLRRFVESQDESAFELLVWRHGALVLHVARQILRDEQAIEDAFQATFLVLFRKASSVLRGEALPGWLHQVAFRIALRSKPRVAVATGLDLDAVPAAESSTLDHQESETLHEEIARLPAKYRQPIVCCYLEGKTNVEAAEVLGWPVGTVAGRLSRARDLLRTRLARRGVTLGTVALVSESIPSVAMARRVALLVAGLRDLASLSTPVVALAEGAMQTMFWMKTKWIAIGIFVFGSFGLAGGALTLKSTLAREKPASTAEADPPAAFADEERRRPKTDDDLLQEAASRAKVREQLKKLALAMNNYSATHRGNVFPPPAIFDSSGRPLLSWRVAMLPYLGENELYKQFRQSEPWNSPHNIKLLAKMPKVYAPIDKKAREKHLTYFQVFTGANAMFYLPPGPGSSGFPGGGGMPGMGSPGGGPSGVGGPPGGMMPGGPGSGMFGAGYGSGAGAGAEGGGGPGRGGSGGAGVPGGEGASGPGGGGMDSGASGLGGPGGMGGGLRGAPSGMRGGIAGPGRGMGMGAMGPGGMAPFALNLRRLSDVTDGTSNTILIAEAGNAVPWTKPEDLPYVPNRPVPKLGGQFPRTLHVAMADGSVRSFPKTIDEKTLRAAITINGGEVIDLSKVSTTSNSVSTVRQEMLDKLNAKNQQLKEQATILNEVLSEMRAELDNVRWEIEREKLIRLDPKASKIQRENEELERSLRDGRDQAKELMRELRRLREEVKRRSPNP